jgi:hypothetical protein
MRTDSCNDEFQNETINLDFIESFFNVQNEGKCCFIVTEPKGNAFYYSCQCMNSRIAFLKAILIIFKLNY